MPFPRDDERERTPPEYVPDQRDLSGERKGCALADEDTLGSFASIWATASGEMTESDASSDEATWTAL